MTLFGSRRAPVSQPVSVSVDTVVAVIGGTAEQLVARFGSLGDDWLGRPTISYEHAKQAHSEWLAAQDQEVITRIRYESYREDHERRRRDLAEAVKAQARADFTGHHRGGQEMMAYWSAQWVAERAALAEFDAREPALLLSEFRQRSTT